MANTASALFQLIDGLSTTRNHEELVAALQPILKKMAYYAVMSEGAALEDREDWHNTFTGNLYDDRGKSLPPSVAEARAARRSTSETNGAPQQRPATAGRRNEGSGRGGSERRGPAPNPTRPPAESIPPALRAIMDGSHPSLHEDDKY